MGCLILVKDLCRQAHLIGRKIIIGFMRAVGTHCDGSTGGGAEQNCYSTSVRRQAERCQPGGQQCRWYFRR